MPSQCQDHVPSVVINLVLTKFYVCILFVAIYYHLIYVGYLKYDQGGLIMQNISICFLFTSVSLQAGLARHQLPLAAAGSHGPENGHCHDGL